MSELITCTLEDICLKEKGSIISGPFGSNISSKYFSESGIPVIRGNNLTTNHIRFVDNGFVFVTEDKADELKCDAYSDDIVFTAAGTIGQVGVIPKDARYSRYVISNKQIRVRLDQDIVDLDYAYCWLSSPWIQTILKNNNKGSTVPLLTLAEVKALPITFPKDKEEQKALVEIICDLDAAIDNNSAICSDLEEMAKLLYDYWFVQFDFPDEDGKPYKSSGGKMVWNEELKREIPAGWSIRTLNDVAIMYQPKTFDAKLLETGGKYRVYGAGGYMGQYHEYNHEDSEVFISCRGSCGNIYKSMPQSLITGNAMIVHPININFREYLYWSLFRYGVQNCITGSVQPQITRDELSKWRIIVPSDTNIAEFNRHMMGFDKKYSAIIEENQELVSLRDFLFPMLMNGQVKVGKVEN